MPETQKTGLNSGSTQDLDSLNTSLLPGLRFNVTICCEQHLHMRPSAAIVSIAQKHEAGASITLSHTQEGRNGLQANAASILDVMFLGAVCGDTLQVRITRKDNAGIDVDPAKIQEELLALSEIWQHSD